MTRCPRDTSDDGSAPQTSASPPVLDHGATSLATKTTFIFAVFAALASVLASHVSLATLLRATVEHVCTETVVVFIMAASLRTPSSPPAFPPPFRIVPTSSLLSTPLVLLLPPLLPACGPPAGTPIFPLEDEAHAHVAARLACTILPSLSHSHSLTPQLAHTESRTRPCPTAHSSLPFPPPHAHFNFFPSHNHNTHLHLYISSHSSIPRVYDRESIYESIYVTHTHTTPADLLLLSGGDFPLSRSPPREMSYSKSSKREMELLKIQQERDGVTQNPARDRDGVTQNPARKRDGVTQNPARLNVERERERWWREELRRCLCGG